MTAMITSALPHGPANLHAAGGLPAFRLRSWLQFMGGAFSWVAVKALGGDGKGRRRYRTIRLAIARLAAPRLRPEPLSAVRLWPSIADPALAMPPGRRRKAR